MKYSMEAEQLVHDINAALKRNAAASDVYSLAETALSKQAHKSLMRASEIISETDMAQYPNEWEVVESINNAILKEASAAMPNDQLDNRDRL